ncbi:MAG: YggS family pyridoxal phosphate-dependent enzyme [Pseudomonadales bacterium]
MVSIRENLDSVRTRITEAAMAAGRDPEAITLIAVSKTKPAAAVLAALEAGQVHFGENYVQEAVAKITEVAAGSPRAAPIWHFIGALQTNKTRDVATHFHWVHTVSREKVARRLNDQRPDGPALNVCLQVNVDGDPNKAGVPVTAAGELLTRLEDLERLAPRGLMTILDPRTPPLEGYNRLRDCFEALSGRAPAGWDTLSMGMSGDYAEAIRAGATMVRIGTAIFGARG